jgi:hypothetical protein
VQQGVVTQVAGLGYVFGMGQIVMHMVEQLFSRVETARTVDMRIDWRMVVQVFAIINRGMLDLGNRRSLSACR